jgi:hypothetical protein
MLVQYGDTGELYTYIKSVGNWAVLEDTDGTILNVHKGEVLEEPEPYPNPACEFDAWCIWKEKVPYVGPVPIGPKSIRLRALELFSGDELVCILNHVDYIVEVTDRLRRAKYE